jgi:hypothetical protein
MRRRWNCASLIFLSLLWAASAHAQKVKVEYDKAADFTKYKTYSWVKLSATAHPFVQADAVAEINQQLEAKGLKHVESGGDLLVNGYGSMSEGMNVSYDVNIYAMPGLDTPITWVDGTPRAGNSTAVFVDKGTLVVDLVDRRAKQLKWRGTAKANLDPEQQEKSLETIEKAIVKMFREYPGHS